MEPRVAAKIHTDNGGEFINKDIKKLYKRHKLRHVTGIAGRPQSQSVIERFNGTLKDSIMKDYTATGVIDWSKKLQIYIDNYNNSYHSTIKMTPNEAVNRKYRLQIIERLKRRAALTQPSNNGVKLRVGERVRRRIYKGKLEKSSKPNFSAKIYVVWKVINSRNSYMSTKYKIATKKGKILPNSYVGNDLLLVEKVVKPPGSRERDIEYDDNNVEYDVEKIVGTKTIRGKKYYRIRWEGYGREDDTYEPFDYIKNTAGYATWKDKNKN